MTSVRSLKSPVCNESACCAGLAARRSFSQDTVVRSNFARAPDGVSKRSPGLNSAGNQAFSGRNGGGGDTEAQLAGACAATGRAAAPVAAAAAASAARTKHLCTQLLQLPHGGGGSSRAQPVAHGAASEVGRADRGDSAPAGRESRQSGRFATGQSEARAAAVACCCRAVPRSRRAGSAAGHRSSCQRGRRANLARCRLFYWGADAVASDRAATQAHGRATAISPSAPACCCTIGRADHALGSAVYDRRTAWRMPQ